MKRTAIQSTNQTIRVRFINHLTGELISLSEMRPDQLPPSFEEGMTMRLNQINWAIVSASPATAADFIRSGNLVLRMQKIEPIGFPFSDK